MEESIQKRIFIPLSSSIKAHQKQSQIPKLIFSKSESPVLIEPKTKISKDQCSKSKLSKFSLSTNKSSKRKGLMARFGFGQFSLPHQSPPQSKPQTLPKMIEHSNNYYYNNYCNQYPHSSCTCQPLNDLYSGTNDSGSKQSNNYAFGNNNDIKHGNEDVDKCRPQYNDINNDRLVPTNLALRSSSLPLVKYFPYPFNEAQVSISPSPTPSSRSLKISSTKEDLTNPVSSCILQSVSISKSSSNIRNPRHYPHFHHNCAPMNTISILPASSFPSKGFQQKSFLTNEPKPSSLLSTLLNPSSSSSSSSISSHSALTSTSATNSTKKNNSSRAPSTLRPTYLYSSSSFPTSKYNSSFTSTTTTTTTTSSWGNTKSNTDSRSDTKNKGEIDGSSSRSKSRTLGNKTGLVSENPTQSPSFSRSSYGRENFRHSTAFTNNFSQSASASPYPPNNAYNPNSTYTPRHKPDIHQSRFVTPGRERETLSLLSTSSIHTKRHFDQRKAIRSNSRVSTDSLHLNPNWNRNRNIRQRHFGQLNTMDNPAFKAHHHQNQFPPSQNKYHSKHQPRPAIKITVSPDTPEYSRSNSQSQENLIQNQQTSLRKIMGNCLAKKICCGTEDSSNFSKDDFGGLDFPNCIDFGISDFLCCKDEIDMDLSSDTDTSFLEATPPHRFSDSELEQIEAMSITLETTLNLNPKLSTLTPTDDFSSVVVDVETATNSLPLEIEKRTAFGGTELEKSHIIAALKEAQIQTIQSNLKNSDVINIEGSNGNCNKSNKSGKRNFPRPFRRHISLPATIFMTYLLEHNKTGNGSGNISKREAISSLSRPKMLTKIDSICSNESTDNMFDDENSNASDSISLVSDWVSKSTSFDESDVDAADDFENQAFTSEVEKRSLILRHMRRLVRQDTSGNIAPPDFCLI